MIQEISNWEDVFLSERLERENIDPNTLCRYGIKCLDDSLKYIRKNELVVIGADSGLGKSELALQIARTNAKNGKRVAVYFLEGGEKEAISRMKWIDICEIYYEKYTEHMLNIDYTAWITNSIKDPNGIMSKIEAEVFEYYKNQFEDRLMFYTIQDEFTIDNLMSSFTDLTELTDSGTGLQFPQVTLRMNVDLIIIDHLQYFNLTKEESEIQEITRIIREMKKITDYYKVPAIIVSHLRKKSKDRGLPDQADFYGSSNIPKISTTAITISSAYGIEQFANNIYPTFFRIVKSRVGIRPSYAILNSFDLTKRKYEQSYEVFRIKGDGHIINKSLKSFECPKWARDTIKEREKDV